MNHCYPTYKIMFATKRNGIVARFVKAPSDLVARVIARDARVKDDNILETLSVTFEHFN